ncbi:putative transcription factor interactor and regulator CCHC(Zn) family [Medicago truncatula]|uniref:Putative transcription factor interactor and regulator CCHC(Zn) family n=1 Tax=Medicago truncatula TaxID=3880 RepID=A0A072VK90_MEDTR|nr:polyadenylate-binding protein 2 [Medicago truncatula]KEH42409.1 RNA recognition motif [Medicago truncatula]RHN79934.1 putative transcription factor interactor and regulator CCHC(Zn) family [Medicago truncatula]
MNHEQQLMTGSCTNCGLPNHSEKSCFERPQRVPARFRQNLVPEPIARELVPASDGWDRYLLKKKEDKDSTGGFRSLRLRGDIPEYLLKKVSKDSDDTTDLTTHFDPRTRFNYREKMSSADKYFNAGSQLQMSSWVDREDIVRGPAGSSVPHVANEDTYARSIHVGNVHYACTPKEVQQHFQSCGTVNRVKILTDKFGRPEGFACVEFVEADAVQNALGLNGSELHGRLLNVSSKCTHVPELKQYRRRHAGFRGRRPVRSSPYFPPNAYRRVPRYRRPTRYQPY